MALTAPSSLFPWGRQIGSNFHGAGSIGRVLSSIYARTCQAMIRPWYAGIFSCHLLPSSNSPGATAGFCLDEGRETWLAPLQSAASELHTVSAEFQTIHRDYQGLAHFFKDIFWELLSVGLALTACEQQGPDSTLAPDSLGRVGEWCASKTQRSFHRAGGRK